MGTLYLDRKDLDLGFDRDRVVMRERDGRQSGIPIKLIDRIVLRGTMTVSTRLLGALAEQGVPVICLSGRHSRRTAWIIGSGHNDVRRRLAQYHLQNDAEARGQLCQELVAAKLRAHRRTLNQAKAMRPALRKPVNDALARLNTLLDSVAYDFDPGSLRGREGAAAAFYFKAFTTLFPPSLDFTGRNRRPPRDPVNACLSLGYTLLHFEAVAVCHAAGLDPLLGFFHEPAYGRESLACDMIEPLRPHLDAWAWQLFRERRLREHQFDRDKGACLLNKSGRQTFYAAYEACAPTWRRYLRRYAYRLVNYLATRVEPLAATAS